MPLPTRRRLPEYALKGLDLARRHIDAAPEQQTARRLAQQRRAAGIRPDGPRVLMLSPRDWSYHSVVDGMLATALAVRGADVQFLACGGGLGVCDRANINEAPPMPCRSCTRYVASTIESFGFTATRLIDANASPASVDDLHLEKLSIDDLATVEYRGVPIGELMQVPTRWFLLASRADLDPLHPMLFRRFLTSAQRMVDGFDRALEEIRPDVVVMLSGLFSFESVALAMCRARGVEVITYERTYRPGRLIFSRNTPASHYDISLAWNRHCHQPLTEAEGHELDAYLETRRDSSHPIFDFWDGAENRAPDRRRPGRLAVLFTNVTWDSAVIGRERAFDSIHRWIEATIDHMTGRPDDELIIRIHPAETKMSGKRTREPLEDYLAGRYDRLPSNVAVVGPDTPVSSYPLMEEADVGLVLTSIVGLELALLGKPVVVAGRPHYHDRGFTLDAASPSDYGDLLDAALDAPSDHEADVETARRYAHAFFFRVPVPFPHVIEPVPGLARIATDRIADLAPGADGDLDRICRGILSGGDFLGERPHQQLSGPGAPQWTSSSS